MPLYTIRFTEQGGYGYQCRIRAAAIWVPTSATEGRVYVSVGDDEDDLFPRTALTTVEVQPGTRRKAHPAP